MYIARPAAESAWQPNVEELVVSTPGVSPLL
jgi:hypothetical protein